MLIIISLSTAGFFIFLLLSTVIVISILLLKKQCKKTEKKTCSPRDFQMYEEINPIKKPDNYELTQNSAYEKVQKLCKQETTQHT